MFRPHRRYGRAQIRNMGSISCVEPAGFVMGVSDFWPRHVFGEIAHVHARARTQQGPYSFTLVVRFHIDVGHANFALVDTLSDGCNPVNIDLWFQARFEGLLLLLLGHASNLDFVSDISEGLEDVKLIIANRVNDAIQLF